MQSQKDIYANFASEQILPFDFGALVPIYFIQSTVLGKYNTVGSDPEASSLGMNTELGLAILQDYVISVDGYIHYTTLHLRNSKTANIQIWRPTSQAGEMQFVDEIVLHPPTTVPAEGTIRTVGGYSLAKKYIILIICPKWHN